MVARQRHLGCWHEVQVFLMILIKVICKFGKLSGMGHGLPVYNKRRLLYGLHAAKTKCREDGTIYIVEGYFDQLALYQKGIENTAATLGTALTAEHIHLMKGFVKRAVLIFDSDEAGQPFDRLQSSGERD